METLNETIVFLLDLHLIEVKTSNSERYPYPYDHGSIFHNRTTHDMDRQLVRQFGVYVLSGMLPS